MKSSSGYDLLEGFCHLFKRFANEPASCPTDGNNLLARFASRSLPTDFSVVLFRPNFMLVSEECLMKTHKKSMGFDSNALT
jgi:hypothetical protein